VKAELVSRGLQVRTTPVETGDVPAGQVTAAAPGGELSPHAVVTLSYAVAPTVTPAPAPAAPAAGQGSGNDKPAHDKPKKKHG
jgi:beta-lactam-binding protein with PASTA domain